MTVNGIALAIAFGMCAVAYFCGYMSGRADERDIWERDKHRKGGE